MRKYIAHFIQYIATQFIITAYYAFKKYARDLENYGASGAYFYFENDARIAEKVSIYVKYVPILNVRKWRIICTHI